MTFRSRSLVAAAVGLCLASAVAAQEPARFPADSSPIRRVQAADVPAPQTVPTLPPGAILPNGNGLNGNGPGSNGYGGPVEPMPIFQAPIPSPYDLNPPRMPPHAWPTYAPYNNYSRVAHPTIYPYQAWPFIGPCYPFPKVPLGWRSVKLEWEDGAWWYSRKATFHDYWRIRYW